MSTISDIAEKVVLLLCLIFGMKLVLGHHTFLVSFIGIFLLSVFINEIRPQKDD